MGLRGLNFGSLLIIFLIILVLFGTKKLREIGNDLSIALKNFRQGMQDEPPPPSNQNPDLQNKA